MTEVKQLAVGHWMHILTELGVPESCLARPNRPCPNCGGTDRFSFSDKEGKGTWFCRSCGGGSGFDLLMSLNGWDFPTAARNVERVLGTPERVRFASQPDPARALRAVYSGSKPVREGDPVATYLQARGLSLLPESLRYHPSLPSEGRRWPAMLALLTDVRGKGVTLHRTFLDGNRKAPIEAPKKLLPPIGTVTGACVRLYPATDAVLLGEGVESTLAAAQLFELPGWACVSAHGLESILLPESITRVLICGDNDSHKSYAGERASYALAERLTREGRKVEVHIPAIPGYDWNGELNLRKGVYAA